MKYNIYAIYKGDEYLTQGTIYELSSFFNVKPSTVRFWCQPTQKTRNKGNAKIGIKIDDSEELENDK